MNNLAIEGLSGRAEVGDSVSGTGAVGERRALREMGASGLATQEGSGSGGTSFSELLRDSLQEVNQNQKEADRAIKELVSGRSKNIHETLLTVERADASLKLAMQVRNKILDAYREIMRMQV